MKKQNEERLGVLCKKRANKGFTHEEHKELRALERKCRLKQCSKCGQLLSLNCFAKNKSTKDGLSSQCKECQKQYNQDNKGYRKQYYQDNKENRNEYQNKRYIEDPKFRLNNNMRTAIWQSLKTQAILKNGRPWEMLVGYTVKDLISHIEKQFKDGMTWDKFLKSKIHVDHIRPISLFDFESTDDPGFKECWALKNLQPLWAEDNLSKGNKYKEAHTQDKQVGYKVVETS